MGKNNSAHPWHQPIRDQTLVTPLYTVTPTKLIQSPQPPWFPLLTHAALYRTSCLPLLKPLAQTPPIDPTPHLTALQSRTQTASSPQVNYCTVFVETSQTTYVRMFSLMLWVIKTSFGEASYRTRLYASKGETCMNSLIACSTVLCFCRLKGPLIPTTCQLYRRPFKMCECVYLHLKK